MKSKNKYLILSFILIIFLSFYLLFKSNNEIINLKKVVEFTKTPLNLNMNIKKENKKIIVSIDDTIDIFKDLTKNKATYTSIFDNKTLKYFKQLHDEYGLIVTFYVFYSYDHFNLSQATDKFKHEFIENSDWLKFGFHAYDANADYSLTTYEESKHDYEEVVKQLERVCGKESISTLIRIHSYKGNIDSIKAMKESKYGITGVYTADDERNSYYLDLDIIKQIIENDYIEKDKLLWFHTDYRLEKIDKFENILNDIYNNDILTIFTHEWLLDDDLIILKLKTFCDFATTNGYNFSFN